MSIETFYNCSSPLHCAVFQLERFYLTLTHNDTNKIERLPHGEKVQVVGGGITETMTTNMYVYLYRLRIHFYINDLIFSLLEQL